MDQLHTPKEVAKQLNINYRKVLDMITLGELTAYRIGNTYRVSGRELRNFLEKSMFKSAWKK